MEEIFTQVLEKEKNAASLVIDAKETASNIILQAETHYRDQVRKYKDQVSGKFAKDLDEFASQLKTQEEGEKQSIAMKAETELKAKEIIVNRCAQEVFQVLVHKE